MCRFLLLLLAHARLDNAQDAGVTETLPKQQALCVLPQHPANGTYTVVNKPDARPGDSLQALYLIYSCHHGHALVGSRDIHCVNNAWTAEAPRCENGASPTTINKEAASWPVLVDARSAWSHRDTEVTHEEDDLCVRDGQQGVCRVIANCQSAKRELAMKRQPQICSFKGLEPVVCCFDDAPSAATPIPSEVPAVTTEEEPVLYDYEYTNDNAPSDGCEPIPARLTSERTGTKAWDKCIEYQSKYIYPCEKRLALGDGKIRMNYCGHDPDELHAEGTSVKAGQFPNMVLLGYGNDTETAMWLCGGSIISEKFVLTAARCIKTIQYGKVKYVRTAIVRRSDPLDPKRIYGLARILAHPEFRHPRKYNDIALLETHTEMLLKRFAMPACLPVGDTYNDSRAVAIGFGAVGFREEPSDSLQKVSVNKFSTEDCSKKYPPTRHTSKGFLENLQSCYGDKTKARNICQGDSGGPLMVANTHVHCTYTVVGIISYGVACGVVGVPGIYTRVAGYVPWIESVVWPD